jgi:hypothetical protein
MICQSLPGTSITTRDTPRIQRMRGTRIRARDTHPYQSQRHPPVSGSDTQNLLSEHSIVNSPPTPSPAPTSPQGSNGAEGEDKIKAYFRRQHEELSASMEQEKRRRWTR